MIMIEIFMDYKLTSLSEIIVKRGIILSYLSVIGSTLKEEPKYILNMGLLMLTISQDLVQMNHLY